MIRKALAIFVSFISLAPAISFAAPVDTPQTGANLSAAAIVDKNIAARGGLQAWRAVQTMSMEGKVGAGGNRRPTLPVPSPDKKGTRQVFPVRPADEVQLPFMMRMMRPRKTRIELIFNGQTAVQVFDGSNGWKLRPFLNRRVVEPYTPDEMKAATMQADIDGPLVDYAAKGTKIELAGVEKVDNRAAYKLKLTLKTGQSVNIWIDAQTFLETKIEGQPRQLDGVLHPVEIYYRDYRPVNGLQIPFVLETKVLPVSQSTTGYRDPVIPTEKINIEKVEVNPKLDAVLFSKPEALQSEDR
jgi:hypothetical protein